MLNFKSLEGKNIFNTTEPIPLNFSNDPVLFEKLSEALLFDLETSVDYEEAMNVIKVYESKLGGETVELILLIKRTETQNQEIGVYLGFLDGIRKDSAEEMTDKSAELNPEHLRSIYEVINRYTDEMIAEVAKINDPEEAKQSLERQRMRDDVATVYQTAKHLRWYTAVADSKNRANYIDFWVAFDKLELMHQAVGIINTKQGRVRHELRIRKR